MKEYTGLLSPTIMASFPSGTGAASFADWVANHAGLEQCLSVAGFLDPTFYEVGGLIFRDVHVAEMLAHTQPSTPFGNDPRTVERYFNLINLAEFFLMSADDAVKQDALLEAFGNTLRHFWRVALKARFPDRSFEFAQVTDLFGEEGLCLTFWQDVESDHGDERIPL